MTEENQVKGFVKTYRSLLDWEWWDDHNTTRLFLYILLAANYEPKKWQGIVVPTGGLVTSLSQLSKKTGLSLQAVRTSLNKLISTNEITKQSTSKYTVLKVNNWDLYQGSNKEINNPATNEQQTNNKRTTTTKEIKKERNKELKEINKEKSEKQSFSLADCVDTFFNDSDLKAAFMDFANMKKGMKNPITSKRRFMLLANELKRLSQGKKEESIQIINQSIMNGWKGFYELKSQQPKYQKKNNYVSGGLPDWYSKTEVEYSPEEEKALKEEAERIQRES